MLIINKYVMFRIRCKFNKILMNIKEKLRIKLK